VDTGVMRIQGYEGGVFLERNTASQLSNTRAESASQLSLLDLPTADEYAHEE
jgi:hypothetical protein